MSTSSDGAANPTAGAAGGAGGLLEEGESNGEDSTIHVNEEDEPPDLPGARRLGPGGGSGEAVLDAAGLLERLTGRGQLQTGPQGPNLKHYLGQDGADPFELMAQAKQVFMSKGERSLGISKEVREVMYQHHWDKFLVDCRRTVEMTKRGKQEVYTAMVATGNMKGLFGLGLGVAETAQLSVARAYLDSYSRLTTVPLYRGHTIYHHIDHSYHKMKMRLMPRPEGWGLRCSDLLYELCSVAGIRNISIKLIGRRQSKFYVAQCFMEALQQQTTPHDGVEGTGMYIREVYRNDAAHRPYLASGAPHAAKAAAATAA